MSTDKKGCQYYGIIHNIPKNLFNFLPHDLQLDHGCVELFTSKRDANKRIKGIKTLLTQVIKENKGFTHSDAVMTPSEYVSEHIHLDVKEYCIEGMANSKRNKSAIVKHLDKTINLIEYFHSEELASVFTEDTYRVLSPFNIAFGKTVQACLENPY